MFYPEKNKENTRFNEKNVLIVHPYFSVMGGAESVSVAIIRLLQKNDFSVYILTADDEAVARKAIKSIDENIKVQNLIFITPFGFLKFFRKSRPALLAYAFIVRYIKRIKIDPMLIVSTYGELPEFAENRAVSYVHYPLFSLSDGQNTKIGGRLSRNPIARNLYTRICRIICGFAGNLGNQSILTNSKWTKKEIERVYLPTAEASVIYPPVRRFVDQTLENQILKYDSDVVFRILNLGRLVPYKGHSDIIKSLHNVSKRVSRPIEIIFAGRGGVEGLIDKDLLDLNGVKISFCANPTRKQLAALVSSCHSGVSAFAYEHFGIAVAELTESGLPVVVPTEGGQSEIVKSSNLKYNNFVQLEDIFTKLIGDRDFYVKSVNSIEIDRFSLSRFELEIQKFFD